MEGALKVLEHLTAEQEARNELLTEWNDRIEDLIFGPIEDQIQALPESLDEGEVARFRTVSDALYNHLLETLEKSEASKPINSVDDEASQRVGAIIASSEASTLICLPDISESVRCVRNWLRFYLQIYPSLQQDAKVSPADLVKPFQTRPMMRLYMVLLEQTKRQPVMARQVGQILFYSTFQPLPSRDEQMQSLYTYLIRDLELPRRILRLYVTTDSVGLALALTQNIHNLVSSAPGAKNVITETAIESSEATTVCPWVPSDGESLSYRSVLDKLLEHSLCESEPTFPGEKEDYRAEIVSEILRMFFALRIGSELTSLEKRLVPIVIGLDKSDPRSLECQRSIMVLLTEVNPASIVPVLVESCMGAMLGVLDLQIDAVVSSARVDDAAAAALTPVLLTFYRFCKSEEAFRDRTRMATFPSPLEIAHAPIRNAMTPEDAPEGTLRWKLIRLLTWPQSHIKRFAAELLFLLCRSDPQEFARRVGMGNAMPFLSSLGCVELPPGVFQ
jgi:hypothetical protein